MPDVTQRVNYFDRQFLRAVDFQDEQAYHLDRRRGHNAGFHSAGVVEGLEVSAGDQADTVTVGRGWAVDARGREIVLATPRPDVPTGGADVEIWISYPDPEPLSTPVAEAGTTGSPRVREEAVITVVPPGTVPTGALLLARMAGGSIDNAVRTLAGLKSGAVTEANLANNAVSSRALAEAEAGTSQDANSGTGVKTPHLKDRAVTEPKLADNAASTRVIPNLAVTEPKLANNAVSGAKLRSDASVDSNRAVGPNHVQSSAITSRAIAVADPGATQDVTTGSGVKTTHLKDEAVTAAKLADNAVTASKIQSHPTDASRRAVGPEHIRAGSVGFSQLRSEVVLDQQVSVPAAPAPGQVAELQVPIENLDGHAFYLVSVQYVGPRSPIGPLTTTFTWSRRNTLIRGIINTFIHRHDLLIQNPNTQQITVACRAVRLIE